MNMFRPGDHRSLSLIALLVLTSACAPDEPVGDGGAIDGAGRCAPDVIDGVSCLYERYGTTCSVPCSLPADCTFDVWVTWTGNSYCCHNWESSYTNCVCEGGFALCARSGFDERIPPISTCEYCDEPDAGIDGAIDGGSDAAIDADIDASIDADIDAAIDSGTDGG